MVEDKLKTAQKAQAINLDSTKYGTFAEIGAGQEVARWFFRVGGAAGTVAKSMSAYDMSVSDAIYGTAERYVSQERLLHMLDHEYNLLVQRLSAERGSDTRFFVYANTVAARSYSRQEDGQGWMGIRFQGSPRSEPNDIIMHVRLLDEDNLREQEAVGFLGVNLVHAALEYPNDPHRILRALLDNLEPARVEVGLLRFSGPGFEAVDNRLMALELVNHGTGAGDALQRGRRGGASHRGAASRPHHRGARQFPAGDPDRAAHAAKRHWRNSRGRRA